MKAIASFWNFSKPELFKLLDSSENGISNEEAISRLRDQKLRPKSNLQKNIFLLLAQYKSPLVLLLVFAALLSLFLGEYSDSSIIIVVLLLTGVFGFVQERNASSAVEKLQQMVRSTASVIRSGSEHQVAISEVVPGDIVVLNAGDIVPADCLILEANDLHLNESSLTGESFPAEKFAERKGETYSLAHAINAVFKGTNVVNGAAKVLAVNTGSNTEMGRMAFQLGTTSPETAFEKGITKFGYLLMKITIIFSLTVLTLNILFHKPVIDSLLFALALAVGFAPELLPAIVTVTLSEGARRLARKKVIVKRLTSIQNLGEMDVLCSDKTGTLTEGKVTVHETVDITGRNNFKLRRYAYLNASFETGFSNPIDEALRVLREVDITSCKKRDEVPYDFVRKRLSVVVEDCAGVFMITKGAVDNIVQCCSYIELSDGQLAEIESMRCSIQRLFLRFSEQGFRTIAIAYKDVSKNPVVNKNHECEMIFLGFVTFFDPPKQGIKESIVNLKNAGVRLKMITGDNRFVARYVANQIGILPDKFMCGEDLHQLSADALRQRVDSIDLFAEIEPIQKERLITALQKSGHIVGYLGDGINDANALKIADVGISIDNAVDVAKEAAAFVLLEKNVNVILDGVFEGRKTFANTLKYIYATTSANFGNMFSMAAVSLLLPFLPLLPTQILLNNFLSDLPSLAIASDNVDSDLMATPRRWDIKRIRRFMIIFGVQSSIFDFLTFALLMYVFHASVKEFRTGWFSESLLTEILMLLVIRTGRIFYLSKPSKFLMLASVITFCIGMALPFFPFSSIFMLQPLPFKLLAGILGIAVMYVVFTEITKRLFFRKLQY